jgi:hypothetical protein
MVPWKQFEADVDKAMRKLAERYPAFWYRFPDTREAGRIIKSQPGDFLWVTGGVPYLIELKYSEVRQNILSLLRSEGMHAKRQMAKHRLWERAGGKSRFLFSSFDSVSCHNSMDIWEILRQEGSQAPEARLGDRKRLDSFLQEVFCE